MRHSSRFRLLVISSCAVLMVTACAVSAVAQPRARVGVSVGVPIRGGVVVGGGVHYPVGGYHPYYPYYRPYYPYYPFGLYFGAYWNPWYWGFQGPYPAFAYPYAYPYYDSAASLRLDFVQRQAQVYVDGYLAGTVDDFDGYYQRLRVRPGTHEITVYQNGYRTQTTNMYLGVGSDQKVKQSLDQLAPGETSEPPPQPNPEAARSDRQGPPDRRGPGRAPDRGQAYDEPVQRAEPRPEPREEEASYGTLSLRVQPADAEVFVDGERWTTSAGEDRLTIRLTDGRHHIEIRKDGFRRYLEDVLVRRNATMTLNVILSR